MGNGRRSDQHSAARLDRLAGAHLELVEGKAQALDEGPELALGLLGVGGAISTWFNLRPALRPDVTVYTPPSDTGEVPPVS